MDEWGWNPSTLSAIGSLGILIALVGLALSVISDTRARNLQALLEISEDMRHRWEGGWREILRERVPGMNPSQRHQGETGLQLIYMLNWLEWMGILLRKRLVDKSVVFGTLRYPIQEIILASVHKLESDIQTHGEHYWRNVLWVARRPEINVDIVREAQELRRQWAASSD